MARWRGSVTGQYGKSLILQALQEEFRILTSVGNYEIAILQYGRILNQVARFYDKGNFLFDTNIKICPCSDTI